MVSGTEYLKIELHHTCSVVIGLYVLVRYLDLEVSRDLSADLDVFWNVSTDDDGLDAVAGFLWILTPAAIFNIIP